MSAMDDNKEQAWEPTKRGAEEAFRKYYHNYRTMFYQFTNQLVGNSEVAKDIVSETYTACWEIHHNFKTIADIHAYMYVSCRNRAYNYNKYGSGFKNKMEVSAADLEAFSREDVTDNPIFRSIIIREHAQAIHSLINKLPGQRKSVMQCLFIEDLTVEEVAEKLNISKELVRTVKAKALAQLRQILQSSNLARILTVVASVVSKIM